MDSVTFTPGPTPNTVRTADGRTLSVPDRLGRMLPPGDAALTRRVKTAGEHWLVQEKKGCKVFSRGVCGMEGCVSAPLWLTCRSSDKIIG